MSSVWKFEYSVQERIEALRDILVSYESVIPSQIRSEWLYRAQLVLEPAGWDAYWKLPFETCQQYEVRFPCVVYVTVVDLCLQEDELRAQVEVVGVQDDSIQLPESPTVPLEQLWVALAQENPVIEVRPTAEFIDHYRYFYSLIWMPWDLEEEEQEGGCWFQLHVPARCKLWALAFNGQGTSPHTLHGLRDDAEIIRKHIAKIEDSISSDNEEIDCNTGNVSALVTLHEQLQGIRAKWELLQNPALQNILCNAPSQSSNSQSDITIVWNGGTLKNYMNCLNAAEDWLKFNNIDLGKNTGCASSLVSAFESKLKPSAVVLLCEGLHTLPRNFYLSEDKTIAAVLSHNVVLSCSEPCTTAISILSSAKMSGLTIEPIHSNIGLTVRSGIMTLSDSTIIGPMEAQTQAIMVLGTGELVCKNCNIKNFFTGIIAQSGAKVTLENCVLEGCGVMLQIYEGAKVSLKECTFKNHKEAAIRYETTQTATTVTGGTNILDEYKDIVSSNCTFAGSGKNYVYVGHLDEYACPHLEGSVDA